MKLNSRFTKSIKGKLFLVLISLFIIGCSPSPPDEVKKIDILRIFLLFCLQVFIQMILMLISTVRPRGAFFIL
jgi:hypothetical protein